MLDAFFDKLQTQENDYVVFASYIEQYNEEIIDLLAPTTEKNKLRILEDPTEKGSVMVHGVADVPVMSKEEVF